MIKKCRGVGGENEITTYEIEGRVDRHTKNN
jgi:hypothetical protein